MPWWAWLLLTWSGLAGALAVWIGAAAGIARRRERATRRRQYDAALEPEWHEAG